MRDELVDLTEDLMKFETVEGNDSEFEKAFDYIEEYFSGTDLKFRRFEKEGFRSAVIATEDDPDLMLHGHVDVVDAEEELFQPEISDERIYGRGSADMKSGLACLMKLITEVDRSRSIGLMIVSDEEIGGFRGAKHLIEEEFGPEFGISAEPDPSESELRIITEQKGIMRVKLYAEGVGAHGSTPEEGVNAAEKLWRGFTKFKESFETEEEWSSTVNLGTFTAEGSMNVVPDHAEAGLDVRYTEEYPPEEIVSELESIEEIEYDVEAQDPQLNTSNRNVNVQNLRKAAEKHTDVRIDRKPAASDMRHFSAQGMPAVVAGPTGQNIHGPEEYVEIDSIVEFYRIMEQFLEESEEF